MPAPLRLLTLACLALAACGGGSSSSSFTPAKLSPPDAALVRVSTASPYPASCGGSLGAGSVNYEDAEVEPYFAVNPTNPSNLVGVWQQDRWNDGGAHGLVAGYSLDGGKHWTEQTLLFSICAGGDTANRANYARASDPWVTFSPDGTAYAIAIAFDGDTLAPGSDGSVLVVRSADGGATWSNPTPLVLSGSSAFNDKESITADPNDSHYVYAVWDQLTDTGLGATHFARTTDGGTTWETEKVIYDPGVNNQTVGNVIVGLPDGDILDVFEEIDNTAGNSATAEIRVIRSTDKGVTWSPPITVAADFSVGVVDPASLGGTLVPIRTGAGLPEMVATPGNGLVVVWQDSRFSNGDHDDVAMSRSMDGGLTWSAPVEVNAVHTTQAFTPTVAVLQDGTIGVTYFDFREDTPVAGTLATDYWFTSSTDGLHWSERHVTGSFNMDLAPAAEGLFVGDYQALGTTAGTFVPFFVQTNDAGTANRTDSFYLPPQPVPLRAGRVVTNLVSAPVPVTPGTGYRSKVHQNLMRLMHNEVPNWDAIRASRQGATAPP